MRALLLPCLMGAALAVSAPGSYGAERAGRVLIAAGEVTILRDGQRIAAQAGTEVQSGDTVELGAASNAQLLLTDNSIVALRPETAFRIAEYHYTGQSAPGERSFLALIKGGMRTLTGIIGHLRHDEYRVSTPTATIGIRGTNYALVQCDNNCRNADGTLAVNGTYGAITDGRIAVTNQSGEHVFGANQFFSVQSPTALPKQLIGPPPFLQDTLQGRGRAKGAVAQAPGAPKEEGGGSESSGASAPSGQGGGTGDTSVTSSTTSAAPPVVLTSTVYQATTRPSVTDALQTPPPAPAPAPAPTAWDGVLPSSGAGLAAVSATAAPDGSNHTVECDDPNSCEGGAGTVTFDASGYKRIDCGSGCFIDRNTAQVAEQYADAGVIVWGKWSNGTLSAGGWYDGLTFGMNQGLSYVLGVAASPMPAAGSVTFNLLGATTPTFSDGVGGGLGTGTMTSGTATADFVTGSISANMALSFKGASGSSNYALAMSSGSFSPGHPAFFGSGTLSYNGGPVNVCGGQACTSQFAGFFAGPNASHAGLGYDVGSNTPTPFFINGVAVFKR